MFNRMKGRKGVALVELLIVIAILGILASIVITRIHNEASKDKYKTWLAKNNISQEIGAEYLLSKNIQPYEFFDDENKTGLYQRECKEYNLRSVVKKSFSVNSFGSSQTSQQVESAQSSDQSNKGPEYWRGYSDAKNGK